MSSLSLAQRIEGALWGLHIGDALAMPAHWYYNVRALRQTFGRITKYEDAPTRLQGSIMNLSNTSGGGRGSDKGSLVGDVILHGKRKYWMRGGNYHYHQGMKAGENTLEMQINRIFVRSLTAHGGEVDTPSFRNEYVEFMTTPGSHNDTYAATYHRMFFANRERGYPLERCPDNDAHNVDAIDGLVGVVASTAAALPRGTEAVKKAAVETVGLMRDSKTLEQYGRLFASMLEGLFAGESLEAATLRTGKALGIDLSRSAGASDPMTAWYLGSAFPALLHYSYKYAADAEKGLLASTNAGGENVARGALLGALYGAAYGYEAFPARLRDGIAKRDELKTEIDSFVAMVANKSSAL